MNTKERTFWIIAIIALLFFVQDQSQRFANLNTLIKTYELESNIQYSQLMDFNHQMDQTSRLEYDRGFEDGRTQAAIALINDKALYDYADGYHAALTQFTEPIESNKSLDSMFADLLIDFMDQELSAEESYWDLLEYMTEDPSLNVNTEGRNK